MARILRVIKDEVVAMLPALVFFLVTFNLIVLAEDLAAEEYGLRIYHFAGAVIGALLVAKAMLIADALPLSKRFHQSPLIYVTLWKTLLYLVAALLVMYLERLIPLLFREDSLATIHRHLLGSIVWDRACAILIWLVVALFLFAAFQALAGAMGKASLRRMFFGH